LTKEASIRIERRVKEAKRRTAARAPSLHAAWRRVRRPQAAPNRVWSKPIDPLLRSVHHSYLNYDADPVDFKVTLFTTDGSVARSDADPSLRWATNLRSGCDVIPVPGDHHTMWDHPNVETVVAALEADIVRTMASPTLPVHRANGAPQ
jgi:thioesterase domain-containing protein